MLRDELIELNNKIFERGLLLLEKKEISVNHKKNLDLMKLAFKEALDKKVYTNEDKREAECLKESTIAQALSNLLAFNREIQILELEQERDIRLFQIWIR